MAAVSATTERRQRPTRVGVVTSSSRDKTIKVRTDEERRPVSTAGPITSDVQLNQNNQVVLTLTRDTKEEVSTVEWHQRVRRHFDLSGLFIGLGFGIAALFIIGVIALINTDGSSSSSSSWDWD